MRSKRILWVLPILAFSALPLMANSQDYVYVNGSNGGISNGYPIGPYGGTLNGSPAQFFCVDCNSPIYANTGWTANVTNLVSSSGYGQTFLQSQTTYLEMAWLAMQMMNPRNSKAIDAQLQWAIWYLSLNKSQQNSSFPNYQTDLYWDQQALKAVNAPGFALTGWEILTPAGRYGQEFLFDPPPGAATPEPSTLLLLSAGLITLAVTSRRK